MARKEKDFQTELKRSLRLLEGAKWYWKLPDGIIAKNPFDCVVAYKNRMYALELKIVKSITSIPLVYLFKDRGHQLQHLKQVNKTGNKAYILINVYEPRKTNICLVLSIDEYDVLVKEIAPKKSIKLTDHALKKFIWIDKIKHDYESLWDIRPIFQRESTAADSERTA